MNIFRYLIILIALIFPDEKIQIKEQEYINHHINTAEHIISHQEKNRDPYKNSIVPVFMLSTGLLIAGIWTKDISSGKFSGKGKFFKWTEGKNRLWPHIIVEYLTSAGLIAGATGLFFNEEWAFIIAPVSLGALTYSAINSSGWVFAEKDRLSYGIPIWISLTGAIISIFLLTIR